MFVTMIDKYKTPPTGGRNNCGRLLLKMKLEVIEKSRMIESTVSDVQLFWKENRLISKEEKDITVSTKFVVYVAQAAEEIVSQYEQMYSPIATPEKKKLIL